MTEWTSLSLTKEQKATLLEDKPEGMSNGAWLVQLKESGDETDDPDLTTLMDEIQDMKEGVEFVDAHVDSGGVDTREILNRLDDLETQLPTKVKEELQQ